MRPVRPNSLTSRCTSSPGRSRSYRTMRRGGVHGRQAGEAFAAQDRDHGRDGQRVVLRDAQASAACAAPARSVGANGAATAAASGAGARADRAAGRHPPRCAASTCRRSAGRRRRLGPPRRPVPPRAPDGQRPVAPQGSIAHSCGCSQGLWWMPVECLDNPSLVPLCPVNNLLVDYT